MSIHLGFVGERESISGELLEGLTIHCLTYEVVVQVPKAGSEEAKDILLYLESEDTERLKELMAKYGGRLALVI